MTPGAANIRKWRQSAVSFVRDNFQVEPDPWQVEFLEAFSDPNCKRIAAKACKGPGKTAVMSWANWNFLSCFGEVGEHPKGAATSITADNLKDNLWPEMAKWQNRSPFLKAAFSWTKERIFAKDHPETWFLSARTWPKSADPDQQANTLAGLHGKYLIFNIDESGGVPMSVMAAADAGLSTWKEGDFIKIIQMGNPTHLSGPLYAACTTERKLWKLIEITGDPDDPKRSTRISVEWAKEQIDKYGRNDPWVLVNVFGRFPPASINSLLGPDDVSEAMRRHLREDVYSWAQKRLGVDVARFGDDRTVLFPRQGKAAFRPIVMRHARDSAVSIDISSRVQLAKSKWMQELEFFDDTVGWAHGAIDHMRSCGHSPVPVQFNGKADDPRFKNKRAEMWKRMSDWVLNGGALPPISELVPEMTSPTYTYDLEGRFMIEPKDEIKKRLGFSPDLADALALTFAIPEMPGRIIIPGIPDTAGKLLHEYDPFAENRL